MPLGNQHGHYITGSIAGIGAQFRNVGIQQVQYAMGDVDFYTQTPFAVDCFDQNQLTGGTLQMVKLYMNVAASQLYQVENHGSTPGTVYWGTWTDGLPNHSPDITGFQIWYNAPGTPQVLTTQLIGNLPDVSAHVGAADGILDFAGVGGATGTRTLTLATQLVKTVTDPTELATWAIGNGTATSPGTVQLAWNRKLTMQYGNTADTPGGPFGPIVHHEHLSMTGTLTAMYIYTF